MLWVDPPLSEAFEVPAVFKVMGPNGENTYGTYQVCPITHGESPWGKGLPTVCYRTTKDLKAVPFPDETYRLYPWTRAKWEYFKKTGRWPRQ